MAEITRIGVLGHLRSDAGAHVLHFRDGRRVRSGRGLAFWFLAHGASVAELPMDDRALPFLFRQVSADFQRVALQGQIGWRVTEPELLAERVDFAIDLRSGRLQGQPLDRISELITGIAQEPAAEYCARLPVRDILTAGPRPAQQAIAARLLEAPELARIGLEATDLHLAAVSPPAELQRALEVPTFEALQQEADEATFARRARAVDKERAIAENELANRIELARREQGLIETEAANARDRATAEAEAAAIAAGAEAERHRVIEEARGETERARMAIYAGLPPAVLTGLALRDFAAKLERVDGVTITPDMLGELMRQAGLGAARGG